MTAQPEISDLPDFTKWTPAGQERALDELNRSNLEQWRPFYCNRPSCDGNHHLTVDAPHPEVCQDFPDTSRPPRLHDWAQSALGVWTCQYEDEDTHEVCGATGTPDDKWLFRHARADQHPPTDADWLVWLLLAGRGAGKTRAGSEWVHRLARKYPGCHIALIGPTRTDVRDTMVEGESGLLATARPGEVPEWEPSKMRLTWPNGSKATGYSGEEPDRLRGKQHHFGWVDEPAHIDLIKDVWSNFMFGLRLGKRSGIDPKVCLTTSPLPVQWLKDIIADKDTRISRASTYSNLANLPEHYRTKVLTAWEGTRTGLQEIEGLLLEAVEGALWSIEMLNDSRVTVKDKFEFAKTMDRINVSVDPAGTSGTRSDETGITVQGAIDDEVFVLEDYSGTYTPDEWAQKALHAYDTWQADAIVVEVTYGREMVTAIIKGYCDRTGREMPRIIKVDSRRGKVIRAEPIVAMWERKQAHIVNELPKLETQLTSWAVGKRSPDRLDAMVHGLTDLARVSAPGSIASPYDLLRANRGPASGFGLVGVNHGGTPVHTVTAVEDAMQITLLNLDEVEAFIGGDVGNTTDGRIILATKDGAGLANLGDWIVRLDDGRIVVGAIHVQTANPDLLDATLRSMPRGSGMVVRGSWDGTTCLVSGADLGFVEFAIKAQGYGKVVAA